MRRHVYTAEPATLRPIYDDNGLTIGHEPPEPGRVWCSAGRTECHWADTPEAAIKAAKAHDRALRARLNSYR